MTKTSDIYFTCPHCGRALYTREKMKAHEADGTQVNYCGKCGKEIKESYKDALEDTKSEHFKEHSMCPNCGRVRDPHDHYCAKCGKKIGTR